MIRWNVDFQQAKFTTRNEDRDFVEWHQGRAYYAVWAIAVEEPQWDHALEITRRQLAPYLLDGPPRAAHITLFAAGFLDEANVMNTISEQQKQLESRLPETFELELAGLNSFTSAVYFDITDRSRQLQNIRECLVSCAAEQRTVPYVPHLTVGLYNDAYPVAVVQQALQAISLPKIRSLRVKKLSLMSYRTESIFSPLRTELELALDQAVTCQFEVS